MNYPMALVNVLAGKFSSEMFLLQLGTQNYLNDVCVYGCLINKNRQQTWLKLTSPCLLPSLAFCLTMTLHLIVD